MHAGKNTIDLANFKLVICDNKLFIKKSKAFHLSLFQVQTHAAHTFLCWFYLLRHQKLWIECYSTKMCLSFWLPTSSVHNCEVLLRRCEFYQQQHHGQEKERASMTAAAAEETVVLGRTQPECDQLCNFVWLCVDCQFANQPFTRFSLWSQIIVHSFILSHCWKIRVSKRRRPCNSSTMWTVCRSKCVNHWLDKCVCVHASF